MGCERSRGFAADAQAQIRLALPIMGAQLAQTGMAVVDTIMTGHYRSTDLAAVSIGASLWLPLYLFMVGVLLAVTPVVARARGAGTVGGLGRYLQNAALLGLSLGLLAAGLLWLARPLFIRVGVEPGVASLGSSYLTAVALGFPAIALYQVLRGYREGLARVRALLIIGFGGLIFNVGANAWLIHGGLGLPPLGAFGCGLATAASMWFMLGWLVLSVRRGAERFPVVPWQGLDWGIWRSILGLGLPLGLAIFFESSLFAVIALLVAGYGTTVVAAHQIALNISSVLFMLPLGLGMALTVRVGHGLGAGGEALAAERARHGMLLAGGLGLGLAVLMWICADLWVTLYTPDPEIRALAASLLLLAAVFQWSDTIQVNAAGALRGYCDTRVIMLITLPAYWGVGLGVGYWLGQSPLPPGPLGVHGFWIGLVAGLTTAAFALSWRLIARTRRLSSHRVAGTRIA